MESSPAIGSDGTIYVGALDDNLYAINPDGSKKWEFKTGLHVYSSPAIGAMALSTSGLMTIIFTQSTLMAPKMGI